MNNSFGSYPKVSSMLLIMILQMSFSGYSHCFGQTSDDQVIKQDSSNLSLLIMLNKSIERDRATLYELRNDSARLEPYYQKNTSQLISLNARLDSLQASTATPEEKAILQFELESTKREVDLFLQYRRSIYQRIRILEQKIKKMQEGAEFIAKGELAGVLEITEQSEQADVDDLLTEGLSGGIDTSSVILTDLGEYNWRVVEARRELEKLKARFEYAKRGWLLASQLQNLNKDHLAVTQSLVDDANKQIAELTETSQLLLDTLSVLQDLDTASRIQSVIESSLNDTERYKSSIIESTALDSLEIKNLQANTERLAAVQENMTDMIADVAKQIERKNQWLDFLKSPLAPHNIYSFLINRGPRIILTFLFIIIIWFSARWLIFQILKRAVQKNTSGEREERIETLNRASRSGLTVLVLIFGTMAILSEFGIDISVLLGGAAVFSLAIAFGAQSLVKDYFSGFMILSENQYRVGNVVKINQIAGMVEDISLRTTILRDLEGVAHFIPHGEITIVSNLTHLWSRVSLDIGVAYKENVDQVMEVIMHTARKMRNEPEYKWLITNDPEMLGVDAFADSAIVIKVLIQTKPMKQWIVKREFLRRLKNRFDELGIEIPFPHRTIYHRDLTITGQHDTGSEQDQYTN